MINKYYQQQLQNIRELAKEFSKRHPAAAPMLSGESADPDVERLLEGVAFLTGLLRQKLDDDLPEIIHGLADILFPHFLRPIPATSIVTFSPKPSLRETLKVEAGTTLGSRPVDETICLFQTCFDVEVHPFCISSVECIKEPGEPDKIRIQFESNGLPLSQWQSKSLTFYLGGSFSQASDLFMLLNRYVKRIIVSPLEGGELITLKPGALRPIGFNHRNNLLPFPSQAFSGYRLLQEYFILPHKFLFLELNGLDGWRNRGDGTRFEIIFEISQAPVPTPEIGTENFILFTTPVINLFPHEADPISLDHTQDKVRVKPATTGVGHLLVYNVDRITGYTEGTVERRVYVPFNLFSRRNEGEAFYQVIHSISPITNEPETFIRFTYSGPDKEPVRETLSITLTCTNGSLPERLQLGDICEQTSDSPELLTFQNIIPVTAPIDPPLGRNGLWKLLSHLSLNFLSLADIESLKELLRLYIFPEGRDKVKVTANLKRVEGISDISISPADRLVHGLMLRGQEIILTIRQDHFASLGDLYIFGSVMDEFFSEYASMNSFTHLKIKETISGEILEWPERIGDRPLI